MQLKLPKIYGCVDCYEQSYTSDVCSQCRGKVLDFQELLDYVAELKSTIREYKEIYE